MTDKKMGVDPACYLSKSELNQYQKIRHPQRRSRWLRGRLLIKYLFLNRHAFAKEPHTNKPYEIQMPDILSLSSWMLQRVEVVREKGKGLLSVFLADTKRDEQISVSHCLDTTAISICDETVVGIDLEKIDARSEVFVNGVFSAGEKQWLADHSNDCPEFFYTLLWSVKEAAIKAQDKEEISIWNFPDMDIMLMDPITPVYSNAPGFAPFRDFNIMICADNKVAPAIATVSTGGGMMMTRYMEQ